MSLKITELKMSIGSLLHDYIECKFCGVVERSTGEGFNQPCATCNIKPDAGRLHYSFNISGLINMIQEAYHSKSQLSPKHEYDRSRQNSRDIAIILYFCTLRETLLNNLLVNLMRAHDLPQKIIERLWDDNKLYSQRQNRLFTSLAEMKWSDSIHGISTAELDYVELNKFMKKVAGIRNSFVHEGCQAINENVAKQCFESIPRLLLMFVDLNNRYVHPLKLLKLEEKG